jgi:hypothetical protein
MHIYNGLTKLLQIKLKLIIVLSWIVHGIIYNKTINKLFNNQKKTTYLKLE